MKTLLFAGLLLAFWGWTHSRSGTEGRTSAPAQALTSTRDGAPAPEAGSEAMPETLEDQERSGIRFRLEDGLELLSRHLPAPEQFEARFTVKEGTWTWALELTPDKQTEPLAFQLRAKF